MKCKRKRTILDLFEIYTCDNCPNYCADEYLQIANTRINIYYLATRCLDIDYDDNFIAFNKKTKKFLIEALYTKSFIIWLTREERIYINNEPLYNIIELSNDIHIIVL